jgi:hypothetical protein
MDYFGLAIDEDDTAVSTNKKADPVLPLLLDIRQSDSKLGMDIGGTLAKLVIALPEEAFAGDACAADSSPPHKSRARALSTAAARRIRCLPAKVGETGQCPPELVIGATLAGKPWRLQFMKGSTHLVAAMLRASEKHTVATAAAAMSSTTANNRTNSSGRGVGGGEGNKQPPFTTTTTSSVTPGDSGDDNADGRPSFLRGPPRQVVASGGGAYNFKSLFLSAMGEELASFVCLFVCLLVRRCCYSPHNNDLFSLSHSHKIPPLRVVQFIA